jgi:DNA repair exonuclease SbcCD ATPase subunit
MLPKLKITSCAFILFLLGFTLFTVAPVFAADSAAFKQCQQIKPQGKFGPMKQKKNCFRDVARALQDQSGDSVQSVAPAEPSGGEVAQLNARIAESESQVATLTTTNAQLEEQLSARLTAVLAPWITRIKESESQVATLTNTNAQLQGDLRSARAALEPLNAKVAQSHQERETAVLANNACVARYTTDMAKAQEWHDAVNNLKDKLHIHAEGVAHMGVLSDKLLTNLKDKSALVCRLGTRKTFSNKAARDVVSEINYALSCIALKVDNGAAAECGPVTSEHISGSRS